MIMAIGKNVKGFAVGDRCVADNCASVYSDFPRHQSCTNGTHLGPVFILVCSADIASIAGEERIYYARASPVKAAR